ncbi:hypothetical protein L3Q82_013108, partial [Scortum barcoo]
MSLSWPGNASRVPPEELEEVSGRSATTAPSAPWHIDSKMKGSLSSSVILNAMTQDSVADSLD